MKFIFTIISLFIYTNSIFGQVQIIPLIGTRTYADAYPDFRLGRKLYWITAPSLGVMVKHPNFPFSVSLQKDWYLHLATLAENSAYKTALPEYYRELHAVAKYRLKNQVELGLGGFIQRRENVVNYGLGIPISDYRGLLLEAGFQLNFLQVALRSKVYLSPVFGALVGWEDYNLVLTYALNNKSADNKPVAKNINLHLTAGTRFFSLSKQKSIGLEDFGPVGISPTLGLELYHQRLNLSLNVEKDVWLSINGGSPIRTIKNQINTVSYGIKYHLKLPNERYLRFGTGYSKIRELAKLADLPASNEYRKFDNYQVHGLGVTLSYQLFAQADVELKQVIPMAAYDEPTWSFHRLSAGILWRFFK